MIRAGCAVTACGFRLTDTAFDGPATQTAGAQLFCAVEGALNAGVGAKPEALGLILVEVGG